MEEEDYIATGGAIPVPLEEPTAGSSASTANPNTAEQRRKDFTGWLQHQNRRTATMGGSRAMERMELGSRVEAQLQERLATAEAKRVAALERLQQRAAATSQRREGAAGRAAAAAAERSAAAAERLVTELAAAESRRLALREAEKERLRAEHELVFSRLAQSHERAVLGAEVQRSRLEDKLRSAATMREARLARRVAKAAHKVERARVLGAQKRELQQQKRELQQMALDQKLDLARQRREAARVPNPLGSPSGTTGTSCRTSWSGVERAGSGPVHSPRSQGTTPRGPSAVSPFATRHEAAMPGGGDVAPAPTEPSPAPTAPGAAAQYVAAEAAPVMGAALATDPVPPVLAAAAPPPPLTIPPAKPALPSRQPPPLHVPIHTSHLHSRRHAGVRAPRSLHASRSAGGQTPAQSDPLAQGARADAGQAAPGPDTAVQAAAAAAGAALAPTSEAAARLEALRQQMSSRSLQKSWRAFAQSKLTTRALAEAFVSTSVTDVVLPPARRSACGNEQLPSPGTPAAAKASPDGAPHTAAAVDVPRTGGSSAGPTQPVWIGVGSPTKRPPGGPRGVPGSALAAEDEEDRFERFAAALRAPATLRATQALMRRLEQRLAARGMALTSATRLLRRLFPRAPRDAPLERYPPRVLLCGFMVVKHPEVVFSGMGARERSLAAAARELVARFEALLERILYDTPQQAQQAAAEAAAEANGADRDALHAAASYLSASPVARGMAELRMRAAAGGGAAAAGQFMTIGSLLVSFDESWLSYLDQFVAWKGADAAALEAELVRCAAALEGSMLRKCRGEPDSERVRAKPDLQAVIAQTQHDQGLLRERVARLGGEEGLARLQAALDAAHAAVAAELAERRAQHDYTSATASEAEGGDTTDADSPGRRRSHASGSSPTGRISANGAASPVKLQPPLSAPLSATSPPARTAPVAVPPRPGAAAADPSGPAPPQRLSDNGGSGPSLSASPRTPGALSAAALSHAPLEAVSNASMVLDMLHAQGSYKLSADDAEGAWSRGLAAMEAGGSADPLVGLPPAPEPSELAAMSQEQLIRALRGRTAAIAEAAFWANVASRLGQQLQPRAGPDSGGRGLAAMMAPLVAELAAEVAGLMGGGTQAAALRAEFSEAALVAALEGAEAGGGLGVVVQRSLGVLQRLANMLLAAGAPAREPEALRAHRAMKYELLATAGTWNEAQGRQQRGSGSDSGEDGGAAPPPPALAVALARSLRLLAAQVKLIKVDAANSRLQALAASMQGDSAVAYLRSKFATIFNLKQPATAAAPQAASHHQLPPQSPAAALPRTRAWLSRMRGAAAGMAQYLAAQGIDIRGAVAAVAAAKSAALGAAGSDTAAEGVPVTLRAGLRASPRTSGSGAGAPAAAPRVHPVVPVGPDGAGGGAGAWRWLLRCGVAALVAADTPAVGPGLAETLLWDGERLHAAQNAFQQLVVVTAGMLLVTQLRAATAAALRAAAAGGSAEAAAAAQAAAAQWGPEQRSAAARRLMVVVADPGMRLPDLTAELAGMAGVAGDVAAEERLRGAFMSLVDPSSAAFRSLTNALAAALLLHLALGQQPPAGGGEPLAARAAGALLARVGAQGLGGDVAALAGRLLTLCAVNEAVHADAYEALSEGLAQDEQRQRDEQAAKEQASSVRPSATAATSPTARPPQQGPAETEAEEEEPLAEGDEI